MKNDLYHTLSFQHTVSSKNVYDITSKNVGQPNRPPSRCGLTFQKNPFSYADLKQYYFFLDLFIKNCKNPEEYHIQLSDFDHDNPIHQSLDKMMTKITDFDI
eukprot:1168062_1